MRGCVAWIVRGLLVGLTACGSPSHGVMAPSAPCPVAPIVAPAPAAALPTLTDADVTARTHALFDALDRADASGFQALVSPAFVAFANGRFHSADQLAHELTARAEAHVPARSRTWAEQRVVRAPGVAVFTGETIERRVAEASHPAGEQDNWETVVWAFDGASWKAAHGQTQQGGIDAERGLWNDLYRSAVDFNHKPNQLLVDTVAKRRPGTALDIDMGQGRNALYLASRGWAVTGIDISDEGLREANAEAAAHKLKLDTVLADDANWDFGTARWDLVTLIYASDGADVVRRIKRSVKPHGLVVVEFFATEITDGTGVGGFAPGQLAAAFGDGWRILRDEVVEDVADWGLHKTKLVRFVAEKR